jgi:hypothetical protein
MFTTRHSVNYRKDECGVLSGTEQLEREKASDSRPHSINVTMNDIAPILQHVHHAESGFAVVVRPSYSLVFTWLQDVPFIMSLSGEALSHRKSEPTVTEPVLSDTIETFCVSICLAPVRAGIVQGTASL